VSRVTRFTASSLVVALGLLWPHETLAQSRRLVRAPARRVIIVGAYSYYSPWFYDPWFFWGPPHAWYAPYPSVPYERTASLRLQVEPRNTEVFVDGYLAGTADDFDGIFQRLRLEPGEHEIVLYLEGHRTVKQKVYLQPTGTLRIRHMMEPLGPGEVAEPRPAPAEPRPVATAPPPVPAAPPPRPGRPWRHEPPVRPATGFGALAITVQPPDAQIVIDGDAWVRPDPDAALVVQVPEGEHRVEIRREGFASYASTVRVRSGETTRLNVSLRPE